MEYLQKKDAVMPHFIFLDLNMPGKSGIECLTEIRNIKKFDTIAIVIYSTSSYKIDFEETFRLGANRYVVKPNDFHSLKKTLEKAISTTDPSHHTSYNMRDYVIRM